MISQALFLIIMEIRFSDDFNAVLAFSREEALRTGSYGIGPDHLLLGILRHANNSACTILSDMGVELERLKTLIDGKIITNEEISYSDLEKITLSRVGQNILSLALIETRRNDCSTAIPIHLLLALSRVEAGYGTAYLRTLWQVDYDGLHRRMELTHQHNPEESSEESRKEGLGKEDSGNAEESRMSGNDPLAEFGYDLTKAASEGKLDPVQGRDNEIDRVIQILGRRKKNNAILVGDPGVGKSAIVEGIAIRIANGQVPDSIAGKKIISMDMASVVAGTRFRGDFEKRLKSIIKEIAARDDIIIFIDEFHTIVGAGKAEGSLDAANILKPALARGEIQCIGATTVEEFTKYIEKDGALDRRFQKITIEKTDPEQTLAILRLIAPKYEQHHKVTYSDEALSACVNLSERYINSRCLPDKAIDVMDEAGSMVRLFCTESSGQKVTPDDIAKVISKMTGIPLGKIALNEGRRLLNMASELKGEIIGQDEAIDKVCRAICRSRAGIKDPNRPIGCFLFYGPTGVGKTLLAKCLAEHLFDSPDSLVRIDMSEYMEKFAVSRLLGAPPGYVGFEDNGQLTEPVRHKPYCIVLLDEIEKAHPDIFNVLLQLMDEGRLTDSQGRTVSFRNTIVIMTSNVGSRDVAERGAAIGFSGIADNTGMDKSIIEKAIQRTFPPEFIGRLDESIFFNPLSRENMEKIVTLEIDKIKKRVAQAGFRLTVTASTRQKVEEKGYNPKYGARPLRKAILELIEDPVSEKLIQAKLGSDGKSAVKRIRI